MLYSQSHTTKWKISEELAQEKYEINEEEYLRWLSCFRDLELGDKNLPLKFKPFSDVFGDIYDFTNVRSVYFTLLVAMIKTMKSWKQKFPNLSVYLYSPLYERNKVKDKEAFSSKINIEEEGVKDQLW